VDADDAQAFDHRFEGVFIGQETAILILNCCVN
jgi:hypothetical protein